MAVRKKIYYWKCDRLQSVSSKQKSYFGDKYSSNTDAVVRDICTDVFGSNPLLVKAMGCDGNHLAYLVDYPDGKYFFRADNGEGEDDYMQAESALMQLVAKAEVPVPIIYHTQCDTEVYGLRFQFMERVEDPSLYQLQKQGILDTPKIAAQLGCLLRRVHSIPLDGFGFMDTDLLRESGALQGIDRTAEGYFYKQLEMHLWYLSANGLLTRDEIRQISSLFAENRDLLNVDRGVLVHRDPAFWNILGTTNTITALIDWDDAVSGDAADDIGMLRCFFDDDFMDLLLRGYFGQESVPEEFQIKSWLYCLRNMLWKTMLRHYMGYFEKGQDFFLSAAHNGTSLRDVSVQKIRRAMRMMERAGV